MSVGFWLCLFIIKLYSQKDIFNYINMDKKILQFNDTETKKYTFQLHKSPISIGIIDINQIVASNKVPLGKKGF